MIQIDFAFQIKSKDKGVAGSFLLSSTKLCPVATRMEGAIAVRPLLRKHQKSLSIKDQKLLELNKAIDCSLAFIKKCQYNLSDSRLNKHLEKFIGAFRKDYNIYADKVVNGEIIYTGHEVRIDYCQHAISALLTEVLQKKNKQ